MPKKKQIMHTNIKYKQVFHDNGENMALSKNTSVLQNALKDKVKKYLLLGKSWLHPESLYML